MEITRRHLLALTAATAAAGAVGTSGIALKWWDQPANAPHINLSSDEAHFIRVWSGVAFPPTRNITISGSDADLDRFFDELVGSMPETPAKLLRLLLHALDHASMPTHGSRFTDLAANQRSEVFESWTKADLAELRSATLSLALLLGMGWSIHPDVAPHMQRLHSCGYGR